MTDINELAVPVYGDDNIEEEYRNDCIDVSISNNGEEDTEDEEDDDIRLAKEMAMAIALNPNMTPEQLRIIQEKSKRRAAYAASKSSKKKGVKAFRSSFKAGVKAVSSVATRHRSPRHTISSASPSSPTGPSTHGNGNNLKQPDIPSSPADRKIGVSLPPRVGEFLEERKDFRTEINGTTLTAGKGEFFGGHALGNLLATSRSVASDLLSNGVSCDPITDSSIRLTGIVWKRRSGLGKYSSNAAWERRRVVLEGTKLLYYKTSDHDNDDASMDEANQDSDALGTPAVSNWLGNRSNSSSTKPVARGHFDLRKEQAFVAASYGHTGAPTPFALSIKVLGQTKWKLCFDTHEELMEWLAAMTDIVVQASVDAYNALILEAHDPRIHPGGSSSGMYGQLREPPRNLSPHYSDTKEDAGGHRLWATGNYNVASIGFLEANMEEMEEVLEVVDSDEDEDDQVADAGSALIGKRLEFPAIVHTEKEIWGVPSQQILPMVVLLNLALCISRASTVSADMFWHLITFTNIALLGVISKERVVKALVIDNESGQKVKRHLSSGVGGAGDDHDVVATSSVEISLNEELAIPEPKNDDFKPVAGSTTMRIENATDLPVKDGVIFGGWRTADPTTMMIRSVGYKNHKKKCPSPGAMYECIHLDIFESRTRYPDMASRVTLPKVHFKDEGPKTWNAPDLFVITIAIPTDRPKLYGNADNGGGYTITVYYKMRQETRDILRRVTADGYNPSNEKKAPDPNTNKVNAVRLLEEWCRRAPTDDTFMARFKVVPNAQNLQEIGLPSWIAKYNGKPFLIKRPGQTGFLYRHPEKSCIEFDISLHPFPYLAKQGICYMKDAFFKKVLVTFGFLIEGRSDDELPECLIGLFQLCYPDPQHAIQGEDFFAGTSPTSF